MNEHSVDPTQAAWLMVVVASSHPAAFWTDEQVVDVLEESVVMQRSLSWSQGVAGSLSTSWCPAGQCRQSVDPAEAYVPGSQLIHGVAALLSSSCLPAAHCVHAVAPLAEYLPMSQASQGVAGPSVSANPDVHVTHESEPPAEYSPVAHSVQGVASKQSSS